MKTPEEYFLERDFLGQGQTDMTPAEKAFLQRYMGVGEEERPPEPWKASSAAQAAKPAPPQAEVKAEPLQAKIEAAPDAAAQDRKKPQELPPEPDEDGQALEELAEPSLEDLLKNEYEVQLVAFTLKGQEYTVPIAAVQEVIRFMEPTKLPAAPPFLAGIVNLRGRVTPLIRLHRLLGVEVDDAENRFIVICRRKGLQFGLMIEKMKTMYHMPQDRIDWSVDAHLGITVDYVSGLLKGEGGLIGILSVDRIVEKVLRG